MKKIRILTYVPLAIKNYGVGLAAYSIASGMNNLEINTDIFSVHSDKIGKSKYIKQAFENKFFYRIATKFLNHKNRLALTERRFKALMKDYDVAYLWPGCSTQTIQYLKNIGKIVLIENINCHQRYSKNILDRESIRIGIPNYHNITEESILEEDRALKLADFVFSPSPEVTRSLLENHVETNKIIESSYGLDEHEILQDKNPKADKSTLSALFVGSVIPRKGVQLLLDYWDASGVDACLTIIGKIDAALQSVINKYAGHPYIKFVPFTDDLKSYYAQADMFVMPSLEEGSPLVSYLALGAGLPAIVSPMAGEGVYRDSQEGFIIDPYDKKTWIKTIQDLVSDTVMRQQMSRSAKQRAENFIWEKVAQRRIEELSKRLQRG